MLKTPLYDYHVKHGAKIVEFAGWEMPLLYTGIVEEHLHTRRDASLFDVSHMGRIEFRGPDAETLLQRVCTRQLGDMVPGQSRYSHVCNERGGILDDVIISRYPDHWMMVCNASNRSTMLAWLQEHKVGRDVELNDQTEATLMVALQGPEAVSRVSKLLPLPVAELKRYRFLTGQFLGVPYTLFRSGYTGEDGVEIVLPATAAALAIPFLDQVPEGGAPLFKPAGLGARDTLRLEAAMPLYGHELDDKVDSLSAGLAWCIDLDKDFIGAAVLRKIAASGSEYQLVGLELQGKRIARQRAAISSNASTVGRVTSGTFSPTLQKSIAMGYVQRDCAQLGKELLVEAGGSTVAAKVVPLPFYKRTRS